MVSRRWERHRGRWARLAAPVVLVLVASLLGATPAAAGDPAWDPAEVQSQRSVPGRETTPLRPLVDPAEAAEATAPPKVTWPAAATATVTLAGERFRASGEPVRAGALPVWVGPPEQKAGERSAQAVPGQVRVRVLDGQTAARAGITGLGLQVAAPEGAGRVSLRLDYSGFRHAYGGDWGSRLRLVRLPACALTTPQQRGCRGGTPLPTGNDVTAGRLTADVDATAEGTLLAAEAAPSGPAGDYKATSLSPSATWSVSPQTGSFAWSYPLRIPPAPGGPVPTLELGYSSGSVDGRTVSTNNQSSWIGEGFSYWPGFIERRYRQCADEGVTPKRNDLCYRYNNAVMSLNGHATELIQDDDTGAWQPKNDDGSRVERLTGTTNGDDNGEHWRVTTPDGTQYYFGLNRLPGWQSGRSTTRSTWTVPVMGDDSGDPCHESGDLSGSYCDQAWRWNLDYVVDPRGTVSTFWYTPETNHYRRDVTSLTDGVPNGTPDDYVRGGHLDRIDYGQRSDAIFTSQAPGRVHFTTAERCIPNEDFDCAAAKLTAANAFRWPDVPYDQICDAGQECTDNHSPTFFTRKRLTGIRTEVHENGAYKPVDTWTLTQQMRAPGDGTSASLWLASIKHTGQVGGSAALPEVRFGGVQLPNRVDATEGLPPLTKWRISAIDNETGGSLSIGYSGRDCAAGDEPDIDTNARRCFPQYWSPAGATEPERDWFHKYVVTRIEEIDRTGGAPAEVTAYDYLGGAAWRHDDDDGLTDEKYKTWSQWRGYGRVRVTHGEGDVRSQTEYRYFRGMDGDRQDDGGKRQGTVTDSEDGQMEDAEHLQGFLREEINYDGPGGAILSATVNDPWSRKTAERVRSWATSTAHLVKTGATRIRKPLSGGGWRRTLVETAYNADGLATQVDDRGDLSVPADDTCTRTTYARDTTRWMLSYASRVETVAKPCAQDPDRPADVISDVRRHYDGKAWNTAPSRGDVTRSEKLADYVNGQPRYVTVATSRYDSYGRPLETANAAGHATTQTYTPATGAVTKVVQTDALGAQTVTETEPAWGQPTATVDVNGKRTEMTYDPLGRLTGVWLPGRSRAANAQTPNLRFAYQIRADAPTTVSTSTLRDDGATYTTGYAIYDGLLRPRQTQQPAPGGGRLVNDTVYDDRGLAAKTNQDYYNEQPPGATLWTPNSDDDVPGQQVTTYNGMEWPTAEIFRVNGTERWRTTTSYDGERVSVDPPAGSTPTTRIADARGRLTELRQYKGEAPTGAFDATRYTYTPAGQQATITDAQGSTWTHHYDLRGRRVRVDDPSKGTTRIAYNDIDQVVTTTDARDRSLHTVYDALGRKTAVHEGTGASGTKLAEWTYDVLPDGTRAHGQSVSATSFVKNASGGTDAYTTRVIGYDHAYRPTGSQVVIPAAEGRLAGTYTSTTEYNSDGKPRRTGLPAAGDLPQETLLYGYDELGNPTTLRGRTTYVTSTTYSKLGQVLQTMLSDGGRRVAHTNEYEHGTNRLIRALTQRQTSPVSVADVRYGYDDTGNLTRVADAPAGQTPDVQCYTYDHLRRLTNAWTGTDQCATAPTAGNAATVVGGAAPYWQSFAYDVVGNRTRQTVHDPAGDTSKDATATYTYAGQDKPQPHTLTSVSYQGGPRDGQSDAYSYDATGNTVQRGDGHTIDWDAFGKPVKSTDDGKVSTYVYGLDGNRLLRRDDTGTTLALPGMELRLAKQTGALTATRYYAHAGVTVAVRTASGLTWMRTDHQGTAQIVITADDTQAVIRRRALPFGGPRGDAPASWPGERGFVGGVIDAASGLISVGARLYDPAIGRFLSVDPLFDQSDPQSWNGYAYANNSPVTMSDADGLDLFDLGGGGGGKPPKGDGGKPPKGDGGSGGGGGGGGYYSPPPAPPAAAPQQCGWSCQIGNFWDEHQDTIISITVNVTVTVVVTGACLGATGGAGSIGCMALGGAAGSLAEYALSTPRDEQSLGGALTATAVGAVTGAAGGYLGRAAAAIAGRLATTTAGAAVTSAATRAAASTRNAVARITGRGSGSRTASGTGTGTAATTRSTASTRPTSRSGGGSCPSNSFVAGTKVRMADGTVKPIERVKVGDKVLATDPRTKFTAAKPVTAVILGNGVKHLIGLTVDTDGPRGTATGTITTTDRHPFWLPHQSAWVDAERLRPGIYLKTHTSAKVRIVATTAWTEPERVYNLTVADLHTYYVLAGATPVLVHNSSPCDPPLRSLHPRGSLNDSTLSFWQNQETEDIVFSLRPGASEPLIVKPDGLIMNGNHRIDILRSRGYDVDSLPRETYGGRSPMTDEDFWNMEQ